MARPSPQAQCYHYSSNPALVNLREEWSPKVDGTWHVLSAPQVVERGRLVQGHPLS